MLRRVALVRTDVSEELSASIIKEDDAILHSHRREKLKSYKETDPVFEILCFLVIRFQDDGQSP
jgi:hypothetical protein